METFMLKHQETASVLNLVRKKFKTDGKCKKLTISPCAVYRIHNHKVNVNVNIDGKSKELSISP